MEAQAQPTLKRRKGSADGRVLPDPVPPIASSESSVNWDAFHAHEYWKANYAFMRADDRLFLERLRDFFGGEASAATSGDGPRLGVDVGSGANLYPALSMLPLCDKITLWEYGAQNCEWLAAEVRRYSNHWDPYWRTLREHKAYEVLGSRDVRRRLARTAVVHPGSLFDLPEKEFHVGTMFFVAESITSSEDEFQSAVKSFMASLKPGAPFAAAFMRNSTGYKVNDREFPAVEIDEGGIGDFLQESAADFRLSTVDTRGRSLNPDERLEAGSTRRLRHGYDGMILALGHRA